MRYVLGSRASIGGVLGSGRGGAGNGLLTGLVAYWGLDEASGNALDKHSGGLTATQAGTVGTSTGKVYATARGSYSSANHFSRNSETALQIGTGNFALAVWVYKTASDTGIALAKDDAGAQREYLIVGYSDATSFVTFPGGSFNRTDTGVMTLNQWNLVICWRDATAGKNYIQLNNGTPAEKTVAALASKTGKFSIGAPAGWSFVSTTWPGYIGPVAMWKNRTLDATARAALWNGGNGLAYSAFTA